MSGGSFDYLCHKNATDIVASGMTELSHMASELEQLGHLARGPAARTRALYDRLNELQFELQNEVDALSDVWHAVEWWCSNDYGRDQVMVAIGRYDARQSR